MSAALEALLRRDRVIVASGLAGLAALAWVYLIHMAGAMMHVEMDMRTSMAMPDMRQWTGVDVVLLGLMWIVMMIAMMVPSAAPMVLMFTTINRRRAEGGRPVVHTGIFVLGYLLVWGAFSVIAAVVQWGLHAAALLSPTMVSTSPALGATVLLAAGIFQWTPLKTICLRNCRSPLSFVMTQWRDGAGGALAMGLRHGAYCVGCCWVLMTLLFVAGVMNLIWVAAIAAFVLAEKVLPGGDRLGRVAGGILVVAGVALLFRSWP